MNRSFQKPAAGSLLKHGILGLVCLIALPPAHGAPRYSVTDLGTLGGINSSAAGINDKGQVIGSAESADGSTHAFRSGARGTRQALTVFSNADERESLGRAINARGQIAGTRLLSDAGLKKLRAHWAKMTGHPIQMLVQSGQGFRSTPNHEAPQLRFIPPHPFSAERAERLVTGLILESVVMAINKSGQMAGLTTADPQQPQHAFRSSGNGSPLRLRDLGTLGGRRSVGNGINDLGQVTGASEIDPEDSALHAFRSTGNGEAARLEDLGTFGGPTSNGQGINGKGQVTGDAQIPDASHHAFRSTANGEDLALQDLGTLGGKDSYGVAINGKGYVVGYSAIAGSDQQHGFLHDGELHDLNELVNGTTEWTIIKATGINRKNEIAAVGMDANGRRHALLLIPDTD